MNLEEIKSAIQNNVSNGLKGVTNYSYSLEQIEDEVIAEREWLVRQYLFSNKLSIKNLTTSINCIPVDCEDLSGCCGPVKTGKNAQHFEIPKLMSLEGIDVIPYLGPSDRSKPYKVYFGNNFLYHKYNIRTAKRPFVWINPSLNENDKLDGYLFNAPMMKTISVIMLSADPRQLIDYECCPRDIEFPEYMSRHLVDAISNKVIHRFKIQNIVVQPNTQTSNIG